MDQQARKFVIGDNDATVKVICLSVGEKSLLENRLVRNLYFLYKVWMECT